MMKVGSQCIPIAKPAIMPPRSSRIGSSETMNTIISLETLPDKCSTNHVARVSAKSISS